MQVDRYAPKPAGRTPAEVCHERNYPKSDAATLTDRHSSTASATCELKFNFDFYGPARVAKTALHFFANAITDRLRKRQVCLASRRTTAFERAKIGIKR